MQDCKLLLLISIALCLSTLVLPRSATTAEYGQRHGIIGSGDTCLSYAIKPGDSLVELARQFGLGFNEIIAANPGVDPIIPVPGISITLPAKWIVPDVPIRDGIVINTSEMRLYKFDPLHPDLVRTFPVGIGDQGSETPLGTFSVTAKTTNPPWHVPESIRRENPDLPGIVPPGPDNPLGSHAIRLSAGSVMIHGTNRPFAIGRAVSHGCIRLYPEDIPILYRETGIGTRVSIVRQPVKATVVSGRVMVEMHGSPQENLLKTAIAILTRKGLLERVNLVKLMIASLKKSGIPADVSW